MIISHKYKFIFIKTRKTAGTSIEFALSEICGPEDIIVPLGVEGELNREELGYKKPQNSYISFHSYNLSDWKKYFIYRKRKPIGGQHSPASFVKTLVSNRIWNSYFKFCFERNSFDRAVSLYFWRTRSLPEKPNINEYLQTLPQTRLSNWHLYTIGGELAVDYVGQYHSLYEELLYIAKRVGMPKLNLPVTKSNTRTTRRHYSQILNKQTREYIENLCSNEIGKFGYNWTDIA